MEELFTLHSLHSLSKKGPPCNWCKSQEGFAQCDEKSNCLFSVYLPPVPSQPVIDPLESPTILPPSSQPGCSFHNNCCTGIHPEVVPPVKLQFRASGTAPLAPNLVCTGGGGRGEGLGMVTGSTNPPASPEFALWFWVSCVLKTHATAIHINWRAVQSLGLCHLQMGAAVMMQIPE